MFMDGGGVGGISRITTIAISNVSRASNPLPPPPLIPWNGMVVQGGGRVYWEANVWQAKLGKKGYRKDIHEP